MGKSHYLWHGAPIGSPTNRCGEPPVLGEITREMECRIEILVKIPMKKLTRASLRKLTNAVALFG